MKYNSKTRILYEKTITLNMFVETTLKVYLCTPASALAHLYQSHWQWRQDHQRPQWEIPLNKDLPRTDRALWFTLGEGQKAVHRHRLRGEDKFRYEIFDAIKAVLPQSKNWKDFVAGLNDDRAMEFLLRIQGPALPHRWFLYGSFCCPLDSV